MVDNFIWDFTSISVLMFDSYGQNMPFQLVESGTTNISREQLEEREVAGTLYLLKPV